MAADTGRFPTNLATASSPGAMSAEDKAQVIATPDRVRTWLPMGTVFEGLGQYTPGEPNLLYDTDPQILVGYRKVFKVWFSQIFDGYGSCVGYAESPDCVHWTRWPQLLVVGSYFRAGHVIRHTDGYYYMTALATGGDDLGKINLLRSVDGVSSWTKVSTVSSPAAGTWKSALNNSCLMIEADKWSIWYSTVNAATGKYVVGLATSTDLGATWTDDPACPVLTTALSGPNAGGTICGPFVQKVGARYIMWAHTSPSTGMSPTDLQRFESTDRTTWTQSVSGFTIPRYNPASNPHVTDVDGQVADITMCEANGKTYAIVVALSDSTYESHFDLFVADKTIAELVATSEGIVTGAKPDMITNGSFEKTGAYGTWGSCGAWTDETTTGTVARTTTTAEVRPDTSRLAAMKITAGDEKNASSSQDIWGLTAGAAYTLSGWSRGDGGSYGGRIAIRDSSANDLATITVPTSATYGRFSVAFVAPTDGRCSVVLRCPDNSGSYVCFDDLSLVATAEVGDPQRPAVEVTADVSSGAGRVRCSTMAIVAVAALDLTLKDQAGQSLTIPANRGVVIDATTYITAGQYSYLRLNGAMATGKLRGYLNSASAIEDRTTYLVLGIANGGAVAQIRIGPANAAGYRSILMTSQNGGQAGINLHWGSVAAGAITSVGIDGGGGDVLLAGTQITALME